MRLPRFAGLFLVAVIILTVRVSAATFTDGMAAAQNTTEAQYFGLAPFSGNSSGLSDPSMLTFSNTASPLGYVLYRVNGADMVTVGIYTSHGTCVSQTDSNPALGQGSVQALWSWSENAIYSGFGGSFWQAWLDKRNYPEFSLANASLPHDIKGYGVNIYASSESETLLSPVVAKSMKEAGGFLCYEEYTALIPAPAKYVKIEINDVTSIPTSSGGAVQNRLYTRLASVRISGETLVMGEPAKVVNQPSVTVRISDEEGETEYEEDKSSSSSTTTTDLPKGTGLEAASETPEKKSSSSKFEGTITSSSKAEKKASSKEIAKKTEPSQTSELAESVTKIEPPAHEAVYEIRREKNGGLLSSSVTAYIIIVTGTLVLLLVFGRKR